MGCGVSLNHDPWAEWDNRSSGVRLPVGCWRAWLLGRPSISSVVIGARTDEQLADNLRAIELTLSDDERTKLEQVSRQPLLYPYWHQRKTASDRLSEADLSLLAPYLK